MKRRAAWVCSMVWLMLVAAFAGVSGQPAVAQSASSSASAQRPASLVVLSTLAEPYARAMVRSFERANPGVRIDLVVQRPEQILTTLRSATPAQRAHVIWSASTESFSAAAADGLLLGVAGEPVQPSVSVPIDQGIAVRAQHLIRIALARRAGVPAPAWPERWQDLAQGECAARLLNPFAVPGGVGGLLVEATLQDRGWEAGWMLLSALAARSTADPSEAAPLSFVFEEAVTEPGWELMPAFTLMARSRLALVAAGSRDMRLAQRFVRFLTTPPALPAAAEPVAGGRIAQAGIAQYLSLDLAQAERREPVMGALARQWLTVNASNARQSCQAMAQAQRRAGGASADPVTARAIDQARVRAYGPALPEQMLSDEAVLYAFNPQIREALRRPRVAALESQWAAAALERHVQAMALLGPAGGSQRPPTRLTP